MAERHQEHEVKLAVPAEFELPDVDGAVPGLRSLPARSLQLEADYHDADDLCLARAGITFRHRREEGRSSWTVKLPASSPAAGLVRDEFVFEGPPDQVPDAAVAVVRAHLRTRPLRLVARMTTERTNRALTLDGVEVGIVSDDRVVTAGTAFRELEVESPDPEVLDAVVERLQSAGAVLGEQLPKVVRVLGAGALAPPDLVVPPLGADATGAELVRAALSAHVERIIAHDHLARLDLDPEGVHQMRVGARRLRSDLRTFLPLLDPIWADDLRSDIGRILQRLGPLRDLDVLADVVASRGSDELDARLRRARDEARADVAALLDDPTYLTLLDRLVDAVSNPWVLSVAERRARDVVPSLARWPFQKLRKGVRELDDEPTDAQLHRVRILAKRARYACEAAARVAPAADELVVALAQLQEVLGSFHDAVVAQAWCRETVAEVSREAAFDLGVLAEQQQARADDCRREWRPIWKAASKRKLTAWLDK